MPPPPSRPTTPIEYFVGRLAAQPNALLDDEDFGRRFTWLPAVLRNEIMARAEAHRVRAPRTSVPPPRTSVPPPRTSVPPPPPSLADTLRREMQREIVNFREHRLAEYGRRPPEEQTQGHFVAWSRVVEQRVEEIRSRYEAGIARLHPPPTTTPWEPRGDIETMTMIKSLPRSGRAVVVYPDPERLVPILDRTRQELPQAAYHSVVFSRLEYGRDSLVRLRERGFPIFIDHSVFDYHAEGRLDWPEGLLDELIALQAEIPDEEESPCPTPSP